MKSRASSFRKSLTHLAFFAGGLVSGFVMWKAAEASDGKAAPAAKAPPAKEQRASDRRSERPEAFRSGTEILKIIAPQVFEERDRTSRRTSYASHLLQRAQGILAEADKLPPADDVAAAAKSVIEKSKAYRDGTVGETSPQTDDELHHFNSRLIHWLRADPSAALRYLSEEQGGIDTGGAVFAAMSEKGVDASIGWLKDTDPPLGRGFRTMLGIFIAGSGEVSSLVKLREVSTQAQWKDVQNSVAYSWPFEKADELFTFGVSNNSPVMAVLLAGTKGSEGADWLMGRINSDDMDPAAKETITNSREFQMLMRNNPHLPLETRLEYLSKSEPDKDKEQLALEVGSRDVSNALDDASRDWRFAFKNGRVTFEEVYDAVVADLPSLAAGSPDAIRLQVFKELAEENGSAALEALAHTPEPDKWTLALKPTQWMFHGIDPQKFYDYLQKIPHEDPVHYQARLESWVNHSSGHLAAYSRDYVTWVKDMPQGLDREMAAVGILRTLANSSDKALKEEVDALVVDPALRARIVAPPPVKK